MQRLLLGLMAMLVLGSQGCDKEYRDDGHYTVMFYNLENLFDTEDDPGISDEEFTPAGEKQWTQDRYETKLVNLAKVITSLEEAGMPEIIGVCEAENRAVLEDLADKLDGGDYEIVHYNSPDGRGIDVALLYRDDALDTLATRSIEVPVALTGGRPGRDILYVAGLSPTGDTLHLFVNHWKSRWGGQEATEPARVATALVLKGQVSAILKKDPGAKIIIMGDFNDSPMDKSIDQSLAAKAPDKAKDGGLINMMRPLAEQGLGSHAYKGEWNMLDQIIVSSGLYQNLGEGARAGVYKADWMLYTNGHDEKAPARSYGGPNYYGGYSDHLPVYLILR